MFRKTRKTHLSQHPTSTIKRICSPRMCLASTDYSRGRGGKASDREKGGPPYFYTSIRSPIQHWFQYMSDHVAHAAKSRAAWRIRDDKSMGFGRALMEIQHRNAGYTYAANARPTASSFSSDRGAVSIGVFAVKGRQRHKVPASTHKKYTHTSAQTAHLFRHADLVNLVEVAKLGNFQARFVAHHFRDIAEIARANEVRACTCDTHLAIPKERRRDCARLGKLRARSHATEKALVAAIASRTGGACLLSDFLGNRVLLRNILQKIHGKRLHFRAPDKVVCTPRQNALTRPGPSTQPW